MSRAPASHLYMLDSTIGPARAARGKFPYKHRTLAQVEVEAERHRREMVTAALLFEERQPMPGFGIRAVMPSQPCFRCGARSGCEHRSIAA